MKCCGTCKFFKRDGTCTYKVVFPDSRFARAAGMQKKMNKDEGRYCPCHEYEEVPEGE